MCAICCCTRTRPSSALRAYTTHRGSGTEVCSGLKAWHADGRRRGLREVQGNATVKNLVAQGVCDFGLTDTDDFFLAKDAGRPVAMVPVTLADGAAICIPNTAAVIRGTRRPKRARRLVDYLASEACEVALANSPSRQVPLGPVDEGKLPEAVRRLKAYVGKGVPLAALHSAREACLAWLKEEYLK